MNIAAPTAAAPAAKPLTDPSIKYSVGDGIPNWTTLAPVHAGLVMLPTSRFDHDRQFALRSTTVGAADGYASLDDAIAAVQSLATPSSPAVGILERDGAFFGHEAWTYTQKTVPLKPSTRLSGSTITSYKPMTDFDLRYKWLKPAVAGLHALVTGSTVVHASPRQVS